MNRLRAALACLTLLPCGPRTSQPSELGGSLLWFPLVGLLIGSVLAVVATTTLSRLSPLAAAACVLLVWVAITGALHLDGLCDVADGLYAGRTPQERLRIMKDPHVGAVAVVSVTMLLLGKFALLAYLLSMAAMRPLLISPCLGRYAMVLLGSTLPYARPEGGTAAPFVQHVPALAVVGATAMALLTSGALLGWMGVGLFAIAVAGIGLLRTVFLRALGGITGDALGAGGELIELLTLLAAALTLGRPS